MMNRFEEQKLDFKVFAPCAFGFNYEGTEKYLIKAPCFNKWDRLLFYYKYGKVYDKLMKEESVKKYDILHAHSLFSNGYIAYRIFKQYNIPYIVAVRNTDINTFFKYFIYLRKLGIRILDNASKVIFISNAYKKKLLEKYIPEDKRENINNKSIVLPNGIDDYFLDNVGETKTLDGNKLNLVYTGRVDSNKNLITTIKCCDKILKNKYDINLAVIGKITDKKYNKIIKEYPFINYLGEKNKEEIVQIYRNMDIFVMPSKHETFGLTYVEAMSQGLPVIYTKNEGFDQFFPEGEVGFSMKYDEYEQMAKNIDEIVKKYNKISRNCIEKSKDFNWQDITAKYIDLYKNLKG